MKCSGLDSKSKEQQLFVMPQRTDLYADMPPDATAVNLSLDDEDDDDQPTPEQLVQKY